MNGINNKKVNNNDYSDIINKSRPESYRHKKMSNYERAAQFSPFAALTGYKEAVNETARLTDKKITLDETSINILNDRFALLRKMLDNGIYDYSDDKYRVLIKYFIKDDLKDGGRYEDYSGFVRVIDDYDRIVVTRDGRNIPIDDIISINADFMDKYIDL